VAPVLFCAPWLRLQTLMVSCCSRTCLYGLYLEIPSTLLYATCTDYRCVRCTSATASPLGVFDDPGHRDGQGRHILRRTLVQSGILCYMRTNRTTVACESRAACQLYQCRFGLGRVRFRTLNLTPVPCLKGYDDAMNSICSSGLAWLAHTAFSAEDSAKHGRFFFLWVLGRRGD
jgi:hypothetical protein